MCISSVLNCCGCTEISNRQPMVTFHDVIDAFEPISGPNNSRGFDCFTTMTFKTMTLSVITRRTMYDVRST